MLVLVFIIAASPVNVDPKVAEGAPRLRVVSSAIFYSLNRICPILQKLPAMTALCSVKAVGGYFRCSPRPGLKVAICDLRAASSSLLERIWQKSSLPIALAAIDQRSQDERNQVPGQR
jgi:hypothetical protein